jgi:hypothetical protein
MAGLADEIHRSILRNEAPPSQRTTVHDFDGGPKTKLCGREPLLKALDSVVLVDSTPLALQPRVLNNC